jgi:hypothetical protein
MMVALSHAKIRFFLEKVKKKVVNYAKILISVIIGVAKSIVA